MNLRALVLAVCFSSIALAVPGSGSPGQDALEVGKKAMEEKPPNLPEAEQKFKEAIGADSTLVEAYWRLAAVDYLLKKYKEGVVNCRRSPDQTDPDVREQLGLNLYKDGQTAEAVKVLEGVVRDNAGKYSAQLQLGLHYSDTNKDPKRAVLAFEEYLKSRPNDENTIKMDTAVRTKLGMAYMSEKDYDNAQRVFEELARAKPGDGALKALMGTVYAAKREQDPKACDKAITIFESILRDAPKQPSIYLNLGYCYLKNNRAADAQREADLYTKAKQQDARGYLLQGDSLLAQNKPDKALLFFHTAKALDSKNPTIIAKIGLTDVKLKNYDAAVTELEQAQKAAPSDLDVLCALAEAYTAKKLKDKVNAIAGTLDGSKEMKAQLCAANAYFQSGNDDKAMVTYQTVVQSDSRNVQARGNLVQVYNRLAGKAVEKNDLAKAQLLLGDAERLAPEDLYTLRNQGLVFLLAKKYIEAETPLQKGLKKLKGNDLQFNRLLARSLLGQSKRDKAKSSYEAAAQIALRVKGVDLANVYAELGPLYVESGQVDQAVTVLESALREAGASPVVLVVQRNLAIAYLARGIERMRAAGQSEGALNDVKEIAKTPKAVLTAKEWNSVACVEGAAALKASKIADAEEAFDRAAKGGGCQFKPPWDKVGADFWGAYAGYRDSNDIKKREAAVKKFQGLQAKAQGAVLDNLRILIRSGLELLGYDYYSKSNQKAAEANLRGALKVQAKGDKRELEHNLAVLDMMKGLTAQAEKVFQQLGGKPCEARANLGIIKDRQGDGKAALELYRSAQSCGVHGHVKEWIDVKQRIYGGGGS
jgi:tetratricopeptide (TPR) repeat protein